MTDRTASSVDAAGAPASERTVLLRGGEVHSPADPFATAMVVERGHIAWVGSEGAADAFAQGVDEVVDLGGALVTPAFTDAHVHATSAGLALTGLDLTGAASLSDALGLVRAYAERRPADRVLLGHGWDASRWPERRAPRREELDEAAGGRPLYLSRIDVHSAVVTTALLDLVPAVSVRGDEPLTREDHHAVRRAALAAVTPAQRAEAQRAALDRAASLGIGSVHECGGPDISSAEDFADLLNLARERPGPRVFGYWADRDLEQAKALGAIGAAGDLFVDGALGSHTACLHAPYTDAGHTGTGYLDAAEIAEHVAACTEAGLQAGFHAIGDAALTAVVEGVRAAAEKVGLARVRAARHRVEHAEMMTPATIAAFADLGLTASVQPAFDAAWGGEDGMYADRLGAERARTLNPFAALLKAGVPLAFGSDAPVTPFDPWGTVRAAAFHRTPEHRISVRAAFTAHTRGGWRALGRDGAGVLVPGAPADYALWETAELVVQAPDDRVARWSTDPRSGTPGLPDLTPGRELPVCLATVVGGREVFVRPQG
ncbi:MULTISPECIES: amidohydrolase [unclassified Streptomyces]|uniref:amidohydrolase n=1 Tax=unclassified Streptomyces TaxID=2593676 RepID=UPI00225AC62D|nr:MULTISPECIES: amidohydrolase [unclassified Streptomyces]MCX5148906.1 amidohydrolase [Streptomyces sp. NBC_00320]WSN51961.1 amidohydrolase [Streptomyces sp. NBC_01296]WSW58618.1 amidohydrolase [Streptomyces sp. NBC_00998]